MTEGTCFIDKTGIGIVTFPSLLRDVFTRILRPFSFHGVVRIIILKIIIVLYNHLNAVVPS